MCENMQYLNTFRTYCGLIASSWVEWAPPGLWLVIVRERILLPFAVGDIAVEPDVRMHRQSIISQHASVNAPPDWRGDRLRRYRIDEQRSRLEYEHNAGAKISAKAATIRGRCAYDKHLAAFERELPERVIGYSMRGWIAVAIMEMLQYLPEAGNERRMICNGWIWFEECDQAGSFVLLCRDQPDELLHVRQQIIQAPLSDERIEHLSARLAGLPKEAWIVRRTKLCLILLVCFLLPAIFGICKTFEL
jgi:hypothetical protein